MVSDLRPRLIREAGDVVEANLDSSESVTERRTLPEFNSIYTVSSVNTHFD